MNERELWVNAFSASVSTERGRSEPLGGGVVEVGGKSSPGRGLVFSGVDAVFDLEDFRTNWRPKYICFSIFARLAIIRS
jgi:hypothetical protein